MTRLNYKNHHSPGLLCSPGGNPCLAAVCSRAQLSCYDAVRASLPTAQTQEKGLFYSGSVAESNTVAQYLHSMEFNVSF